MSPFKDTLANDMGTFFNTDEFALTVTYNPGTGPVSIQAVVDYGDGQADPVAKVATITVQKSQVPDPDYRHTFVIDGLTWYVSAKKDKGTKIPGDDYVWVIPLNRDERVTSWQT